MTFQPDYEHTQRSVLCLGLYATGIVLAVTAGLLALEPALLWTFVVSSGIVFILAASFHHLTVRDQGDRLQIAFGPLPLFRRSVLYSDLQRVEVDRTKLIEGVGIQMSARGGWVWNIKGRDCVMLKTKRGALRVGTDEPATLAEFLNSKVSENQA